MSAARNSANRVPVKRVITIDGGPTVATKRKSKRTTLRSGSGKKLYAVRDKQGKFEDIQSYERAHGQDVRRRAKSEQARKKK
jgi:hypothetical protein